MCHFMEIEFSCSTADDPHRLKTQGLLPCDDFQNCAVEVVTFKKQVSEARQTVRVVMDRYKAVKVAGDCQKCAERKTKLIQNEERIFRELKKEFGKMDKNQEVPYEGNAEAPRDAITLKQIHQDRADHQPDTICASGSCNGLVMVSVGGVQGMFCKRHTCCATEWDCLLDVSTTRNSRQYSIYCPAHTCITYGCGLKIADLSTAYCTRHQAEIYMEFASRN
ncbi:hypothetical protein FLONG3_3873 [Fusarium longipes]|uniref:Uncharacterized protein n=1 Tax=Fusarium longipes TaxID=694270 RepID=A0A395T016_9HYPO|nr:hypothetical protein FLONG3_3873 [Fusarium longipes]